MPFDYFNNSHLAFGSRITRAFRQLESLANDAENLIENYSANLAYFSQYVNRNYPVPFPTNGYNPVQVAQLFDILNDEINIRELYFDGEKLHVKINYFNNANNRFVIASGETTLKEGYAYIKMGISNSNPEGEILFSENEIYASRFLLFRYRIDSNNKINLIKTEGALMKFRDGDINHIQSLRIGDQVTLPYTSTDYEAILVQGQLVHNGNSVDCTIDDTESIVAGGSTVQRYGIVYMKPNETLKATTYSSAYKVIYE